jgi:hypothetical protein
MFYRIASDSASPQWYWTGKAWTQVESDAAQYVTEDSARMALRKLAKILPVMAKVSHVESVAPLVVLTPPQVAEYFRA